MRTRCVSLATRGVELIGLFVVVALALPASAQKSSSVDAELSKVEKAVSSLVAQPIKRDNVHSPTYFEERLADGELFYRLEDYTRAAIIFTDLVENHANHRAFPDALYLLADSLYMANDVVGARRRFEQVLQQASSNAAYRPYVQRSLGRLIEIAIRTRNFEGVEQYFGLVSQLAPAEVEAATAYYRGKFLYNRAVPVEDVLRADPKASAQPPMDLAQLDQARQAFESVKEGSPYYPQARYFIGVIHTLKREFPQAINAFLRVVKAPATTEEHAAVADLARLAVGRLYYETDQLDAAVQSYQTVPRTSPHFDRALYEVAWVFIRLGDATRAERALEILAIASPDSRYLADGELLRGNLLLRNGKHDEAEEVFKQVRKRFGPIQRELEDMVKEYDDPVAHFRDLVRENMDDFDPGAFLPARARQWSEADADMDRALSVLSDLSTSRRMTNEIEDLIDRLNAALGGANRVHAFADLRRDRERSVALRNQLAVIRAELLARESATTGNAELDKVRAERRQLEPLLKKMPRSDEDFEVRDQQLFARYREMSKELSALGVEVMGLEARLTALERYSADSKTPAATEALKAELEQHRAAAKSFRKDITEYVRLIELARLQVGVGDSRYQRDDRNRAQYLELIARERQLMASLGIRRDSGVDAGLERAARLDASLAQRDAAVDVIVEERISGMRSVIDEETEKLAGYRTSLDSLSGEAEEVVGGVTYANFESVRKRFYDLVLRADVGRIDIAWARREEHRMKVDTLTRARSSELQAIDGEFEEISDTGTSTEPEAAQ